MLHENLKAPFPYFGGKASIAHIVWQALGQPRHYIEPFFGSGAVLLQRPEYNRAKHVETVNDKDGHVCNVWRAIKTRPDEVVKYCDYPVNHADLAARRKALMDSSETLLKKLADDVDYCDPRLAGFWIWATSCWIGGGLLKVSKKNQGDSYRKGVKSKRPHLSDSGNGVHAIAMLGDNAIRERLNTLADRLRYVRVVCGEWNRVCGGNWQDKIGDVGMFFDPPYGVQDRAEVYNEDSRSVASDVMTWCLERGDLPTYKIVIAGYNEYSELLNHGWIEYKWKANGGLANQAKDKNLNRHREVLYLSPNCNIIE